MEHERPHDECGVVGVFGNVEAAKLAYLGLQALQHRGQESAGIVSSDGAVQHIYKDKGLVSDVFSEDSLTQLTGQMAIGHVRYSTTGSNRVVNAQPIRIDYKAGSLAIAHNGNIVNAVKLRRELEERGAIFQTTTDSEIIVHLVAQHYSHNFLEALVSSLSNLHGAYSLVTIQNKTMVAVRDPHGVRPLCFGTLPGGGHVVASESCALDIMGAQYLREVQPGEMLIIDETGYARRSHFRPFSPPSASSNTSIFRVPIR